MSEIIYAPFSDEQVKNLNEYQKSGKFHPFTCCSPEDIKDCMRGVFFANENEINMEQNEGLLTAKNEGWVCPCGKYTQNWAHKFMSEI